MFKAYDIRALNEELTDELCYKIGVAFCKMLQKETDKADVNIVIGYDMRPTSPRIAQAVIDGITDMGGSVTDIGLCSSPMNYFSAATLDVDGAAIITASHNSTKWNGLKFCRRGGVSLTYESGIRFIEEFTEKFEIDNIDVSETKGKTEKHDIKPEYTKLMCSLTNVEGPLKIVVDAGNGTMGMEVPLFSQNFPELEIIPMYFELDGTFPNHDANPMKSKNLVDLQKRVVEEKAHFGVAFDGDGDRTIFIDEKGNAIPADFITAFIAKFKVEENNNSGNIFYDLRSSKIVSEVVKISGGNPIMCRVGHSYIQELMTENNAIFAGELSGHYFYREFFNCDNGILTLIQMINFLSAEREPLSVYLREFQKYFASGEINFKVSNARETLNKFREKYSDMFDTDMDGVRFESEDFWFVVRPSNTEPVVRLTLESTTEKMMKEKLAEITALIMKDGTAE